MLTKQYSKTKPTCKVTFTLAQDAIQGAKGIKILGEFNNWSAVSGVPMKLSDGMYSAVIELPTGRDYEFRYFGDNGVWTNDDAADAYVDVPYDVANSVVSLTENAAVSTKTSGNANAKSDTKAKGTAVAKPKATAAKKKKPTATKAKVAKPSAAKAKAKKDTGKDDLRKIEGVGPKIAGLLNEGGIVTFKDLSKASQKKLKGILEAAGSRYKMHNPSTWPAQAKLAAKGEWAKLGTLQAELSGGKKK